MKKLLLMLLAIAFLVSAMAQKWAKNFDFVNECICGMSLVGKNKMYGYVDKQAPSSFHWNTMKGLPFMKDMPRCEKTITGLFWTVPANL